MAFLNPPEKIPFFLKIGIWISEKATGKIMMPARLLSWSPRSALGSGLLESLVVHKDPTLSPRLLKLVRIQVSLKVGCPFCFDMNAFEYQKSGITKTEIEILKKCLPSTDETFFDEREIIGLDYALRLSETPPITDSDFKKKLKKAFSDREIVVLTVTISQVNYWARLIQGFGLPPAGFSQDCSLTSSNN